MITIILLRGELVNNSTVDLFCKVPLALLDEETSVVMIRCKSNKVFIMMVYGVAIIVIGQ